METKKLVITEIVNNTAKRIYYHNDDDYWGHFDDGEKIEVSGGRFIIDSIEWVVSDVTCE